MTAQTSGSDPVRVGTLLGALAPLVIALVAGVAYVVNISRDLGDASQRITEVERLMDSGAAALWGPGGAPDHVPGQPIGFANAGGWGSWSDVKICPDGQWVCGLQQRVEPPVGGGIGDDDTAMNAVRFYCCPLLPQESTVAESP